MATTTRSISEYQENPDISEEECEQDQAAMIRDLVARSKELGNEVIIMKDTEAKANTDNHDTLKTTDIKDIERPGKYDN